MLERLHLNDLLLLLLLLFPLSYCRTVAIMPNVTAVRVFRGGQCQRRTLTQVDDNLPGTDGQRCRYSAHSRNNATPAKAENNLDRFQFSRFRRHAIATSATVGMHLNRPHTNAPRDVSVCVIHALRLIRHCVESERFMLRFFLYDFFLCAYVFF